MFKVRGIASAKKALAKSQRDLDKRLAIRVQFACEYIQASINPLTAVWMGTAVRNWIWMMDAPFMGVLKAKGSGDPGPTGSQALGQEKRRAANEAASDATFYKLKFRYKDPYHVYYLTNNDPKILEMEAGLVPTATRARTRDMVKITHKGVLAYLKTLKVT